MIYICIILNALLIFLFIATAIVWEQRQNRTAAITCVVSGVALIVSVPSLVYLLLKRRIRLLKDTIEE